MYVNDLIKKRSFKSILLYVCFIFCLFCLDSSCPITLSPSRVAVKYGHSVSINCTADGELREMGWESPQEGIGVEMANYLTWSVTNLTTEEALCFVNMGPDQQCTQRADIVLYNYPETVNIISNSTDGFMVEGAVYHLICDVHGVVPAEKVSVMWYINETYFQKERMIYFSPSRTQDRAEIRCEAHMDLMPEGPYINVSSQIFKINVNCKYICCNLICLKMYINSTAPLTRNDSGIYFVNTSGLAISQSSVFYISCFFLVQVSCSKPNIDEIKESVQMWFKTNITLNRTNNGVDFFCGAVLNLPEIQAEPNQDLTKSSPLNVTVYYLPSINTTKLSHTVPVFSGYAEDLKCEADGNPRPEITWTADVALPPQQPNGLISVIEKGKYTCKASNPYGSDTHVVEVIEKVDYLPLIAGFVAVTVVIISMIFIFIYSIYYKNTKMRRYNLKNPKLGAHNGNVAHNGWDLPLPMTKL
uniref:Ig-like domain-containing protein n=1 Tax=Periophthalmus magnuspinnatus TaxID=409849 RepID=A0A3B3ZA75_9GOBI